MTELARWSTRLGPARLHTRSRRAAGLGGASAATSVRRGPCGAMEPAWSAPTRAATASAGHVEQADHGPAAAFQAWTAAGVGSSSTWQSFRLK